MMNRLFTSLNIFCAIITSILNISYAKDDVRHDIYMKSLLMDRFLNETSPPATVDYEPYQFYLYGDIGSGVIGLDAQYAWTRGITGQNVQIADAEYSWNVDHEEFVHLGNQLVVGPGWNPGTTTDIDSLTNEAHLQHGTAVLGVLAADRNTQGVTGMAYGADKFYLFSESSGRLLALNNAIDSLNPGDVLLLEMQTIGGNIDNGTSSSANYVPAEYSKNVWDKTREAVDKGIIVVAAAGNGNEPLDDDFYNEYMNRGNSGSIIVGAVNYQGHTKASFSTWGSRVDLAGYGDNSVYTTGYGDLESPRGPNSYLTAKFAGTSSASPIVAGAVALVQSYAKTNLSLTLMPSEMRSLLKLTGTPQGFIPNNDGSVDASLPMNGRVGSIPNVRSAILKLENETMKQLTVNDGRGSGRYFQQGEVIVTADEPASGEEFLEWVGDTQLLEDPLQWETKLIMGSEDAQITATYKPKEGIKGSWTHYFVNSDHWDNGPSIQQAVEFDPVRQAIITQDHYIFTDLDSVYKYTDDSFADAYLSVDPNGVIWQSDGYKIYEFNESKLFTYYTYGASTGWDSQSGGVTQPQSDDEGLLYFSNLWYDSIFTYDGSQVISIDPFAPQIIRKGQDGSMWFAGTDDNAVNGKVKKWDGNTWTDYYIPNNLLPGGYSIKDLTIGSQGDIWIGIQSLEYAQRNDYGGILHRNTQGNWNNITVADGLLHHAVNAIELDQKGQLWIASQGGLSKYNGISFENFPPESWGQDSTLFEGSTVYDIALDQNQDLWIAARGIHQLDLSTTTHLTQKQMTSQLGFQITGRLIEIQSSQGQLGQVKLDIYSLSGKLMFSETQRLTGNRGTFSLPVSMSAGIYYGRLSHPQGVYGERIELGI